MKKIQMLLTMLFVSLISVSPVWAYKTFVCTGGVFKKNIGADGGECVLYVRYETEIESEGCNGEAWTCYQDAIDSGYKVGSTPKVGAIVVFKKSGIYSVAGHVGIVKSVGSESFVVRESNVATYHIVGERTININDSLILGYIYCDGDGSDSVSSKKTMRVVGETGWYPSDKTCVNADEWVRIRNGRVIQSYDNNFVCQLEYLKSPAYYNILLGSSLPQTCAP